MERWECRHQSLMSSAVGPARSHGPWLAARPASEYGGTSPATSRVCCGLTGLKQPVGFSQRGQGFVTFAEKPSWLGVGKGGKGGAGRVPLAVTPSDPIAQLEFAAINLHPVSTRGTFPSHLPLCMCSIFASHPGKQLSGCGGRGV